MMENSWIYQMGEGEKNTFSIDFGEKRIAELTRQSDGAKVRSGWILSGRRVWVNERYFIWDGEQFVSRDEYWTPQGMTRFTITLDKTANAG